MLIAPLPCTPGFAADIEDIFRAEDTNGDGAIFVDEARIAAPVNFRRIDRDASGGVEVQEIAEFTAAESGPDGVRPADVLTSVARNTLEYWDGNRDGKVTETEYGRRRRPDAAGRRRREPRGDPRGAVSLPR